MKKTINVLSIVSTVISAIALLIAIVMLTFFWKPMSLIYSSSTDIIESGPIIPIGNTLYILGCLIVSIIIVLSSKAKRVIAIEIVAMVLLCAVLPLATWILSLVQQSNVNYLGVVAAARLLITNKVLALPVNLVSFSRMLLLVICGMRVVDKIRCKTQSI